MRALNQAVSPPKNGPHTDGSLVTADTELTGAMSWTERSSNWRAHAACAETDPELFFPDTTWSPRLAKQVCAACPVQNKCLQWAMDTNERFGIWGGTTEYQRRQLRRVRPAVA